MTCVPLAPREIDVGKGPAVLREAAQDAAEVLVDADNQPGAFDGCRDAHRGARNGDHLVVPTRERERRDGRSAARGIENERAHDSGPVLVEDQGLRGAREVLMLLNV